MTWEPMEIWPKPRAASGPSEFAPDQRLYGHELYRWLLDGVGVKPGATVLELASGSGAICLARPPPLAHEDANLACARGRHDTAQARVGRVRLFTSFSRGLPSDQAMGSIQRTNFDDPDEIREFPLGFVHLARVGPITIGKGVVQPGFRWSMHARPSGETGSCQVHHVQLLLSGRFAVRMDDGEEVELRPGDVFDVPPGHDAWVVGNEPAVLLDFSGNASQIGAPSEYQRIVTTLVMSDIVGSTQTARRLGDQAWRQLLADHNRVIRACLDRYGGREVNTTGDGFLAMFSSAGAALSAAAAMRAGTNQMGVGVRVGVHTGEIELLPDDIGGLAVHAAARIMSLGGDSEVIVSAVTRDLVDARLYRLEERGAFELKGLDHPVTVYSLIDD